VKRQRRWRFFSANTAGVYFFMRVELDSPCKVNLILNILGKRPDGFHELETLMHPVAICDRLTIERVGSVGLQLACNHPELPVDSGNLVYRAAEKFLASLPPAAARDGLRIHLEKNLPLSAGLGGGSANAAVTLLGLNQIFGSPLPPATLQALAASLGSDVPFFLQNQPALAFGRGEQVQPLGKFSALAGKHLLLIHPGFGVSTPWAYKNLARFPDSLHGQPGRAARLAQNLGVSLAAAAPDFFNSLEAPVLRKFPLLGIFQDFLREQGAPIVLMSGSGSTTFAIAPDESRCAALKEAFLKKFGAFCWIASAPL